MEHVVGRPVKYTTYSRHGCRCDGCTAANAALIVDCRTREHARTLAAERAFKAAQRRAARLYAEEHPEAYRALLDQAYIEQGVEPSFRRVAG